MPLPNWIKKIACIVMSKKQKTKLICSKIDSMSEYQINNILREEGGLLGFIASVVISVPDRKYKIKQKIRDMTEYELDNLIKRFG